MRRMMLLRGRLAQLLGFFLCELTQSLGLQTSTRVTSERRRLHRIAGLVVKQRIVEDEPEQLEELFARLDLAGLELFVDGGEVHGVFDHVEIVGNAQRVGIDRL